MEALYKGVYLPRALRGDQLWLGHSVCRTGWAHHGAGTVRFCVKSSLLLSLMFSARGDKSQNEKMTGQALLLALSATILSADIYASLLRKFICSNCSAIVSTITTSCCNFSGRCARHIVEIVFRTALRMTRRRSRAPNLPP